MTTSPAASSGCSRTGTATTSGSSTSPAAGDYEASYLVDRLSRARRGTRSARASWWCARWATAATGPATSCRPRASRRSSAWAGSTTSANPAWGGSLPYRSSYGPTVDGLQKPEVITLADWIAAPDPPGHAHRQAGRAPGRLDAAPDSRARRGSLEEHAGVYGPLDEARSRPPYLIRQIIAAGLRDGLVIDEHYKMVDGTSFAAPIVTSVVAQMLEANPALTPRQVKRHPASRRRSGVPNVEVDRQGWGVVQPGGRGRGGAPGALGPRSHQNDSGSAPRRS